MVYEIIYRLYTDYIPDRIYRLQTIIFPVWAAPHRPPLAAQGSSGGKEKVGIVCGLSDPVGCGRQARALKQQQQQQQGEAADCREIARKIVSMDLGMNVMQSLNLCACTDN